MNLIVRLYKITNLVNGKAYVGATSKTLQFRWNAHKRWANYKNRKYIHNAIRKYGSEYFEMKQLGFCRSRKAAAKRERKLIKEHGTLWPNGYNLTSGGEKNIGFTLCEPVREKQRQGRLGKKHTAEAKAKMSAWRTGRKESDETRKKKAETHKGSTWSPLQRERITAAQKTPGYREKMRQASRKAKRGPLSEETKEKIRHATNQNWKDPVYRERFESGMQQWRLARSGGQV